MDNCHLHILLQVINEPADFCEGITSFLYNTDLSLSFLL